jgi:hypothetical protein
MAIYQQRSKIDLIGERIDVISGEWLTFTSHIGCCIDSYYEYLYKCYVLFNDPDLKKVWDRYIVAINRYISDEYEGRLWYGGANMESGRLVSSTVTLYDAYFPALLALSGDIGRAEKLQASWDWLWNKYGLEPGVYDYRLDKPTGLNYNLNPEIIESAYYLYHFTRNEKYLQMAGTYWNDLKKYCRTNVAFTSVSDVTKMEKDDYMPSFFIAETMKYLFLTFSGDQGSLKFDNYIFSTEAHPFRRASFKADNIGARLGINTDNQNQ